MRGLQTTAHSNWQGAIRRTAHFGPVRETDAGLKIGCVLARRGSNGGGFRHRRKPDVRALPGTARALVWSCRIQSTVDPTGLTALGLPTQACRRGKLRTVKQIISNDMSIVHRKDPVRLAVSDDNDLSTTIPPPGGRAYQRRVHKLARFGNSHSCRLRTCECKFFFERFLGHGPCGSRAQSQIGWSSA